ncbi:MAG: hypothetical protein IBJ00_01235 [Alphaproteobacteria bacterium]|nr:hypothetical protein [Alphaproteobacteria bacterium]
MIETNRDTQKFKSLCKRPFACKFFVRALFVLVFMIAVWFLCNLSSHFRNEDEVPAVILDLPNIKTDLPPLNPGTQPQPSPDSDSPEQLPESTNPRMKLGYSGDYPQESL